jgi:TatD DNase family protein
LTVYPNNEVLQSEGWPGLIDTHCHLDLAPLSLHLAEVVSSAQRSGVTHFVVPGVHPDGWERIARIAREHTGIFPAFGIHPMHSDLVDDSLLSRLSGLSFAGVAIGEIGLDPSYDVPLEIQERAFREQVRLAVSLGLPVLTHCRRAFQRTLRILQEEGAHHVGGIMHAFSGSSEMAREFIRLGFAISISGMLTRDNSIRLVRLVRELSLEELVLETDAPDLTPQRYRGQSNQPAYLCETLHAVARIKGIDAYAAARSCRARSLAALPRILMR